MEDIKELQETITNLEKEKEELQKEIEKDIITSSDLMIKNQNLEQENEKLKDENLKIKQEIQATEKVVLEVADKLYQNEFKQQCEYNNNGSCIFYDTYSSVIKHVIQLLHENVSRNICIEELESILERG